MKDKKWKWYYFYGVAIVIVGIAIYEYHALTKVETDGGTHSVTKVEELAYNLAGKWGVVAVVLSIALLCIVAGTIVLLDTFKGPEPDVEPTADGLAKGKASALTVSCLLSNQGQRSRPQ